MTTKTLTTIPPADALQRRFQTFAFALDAGIGDVFFDTPDQKDYFDGIKDTIEFLSTGMTPSRFGIQQ